MLSEFPVRAQQWRDFATAHSCGLRLDVDAACVGRQSLPQRIRAGCDSIPVQQTRQRVSLPQRIRAGCDLAFMAWDSNGGNFATAHSCGLRRFIRIAFRDFGDLCHSAFVRVATVTSKQLPLRRSFATAHSCGLRLETGAVRDIQQALPQHIRAGCDLYSAI